MAESNRKELFNIEPDLARFNRWFKEFDKISGVNTGVAIRNQALHLMKDIMGSTPVNTGRARMGWSGLHRKLGKRIAPRGNDPKAQAEGKALGTAKDNSNDKRNPYVEITNNVKYILMLEVGHSKKIPPGGMINTNLKRHADRLKETVAMAISEAGKESQNG